MSKRTMTKKPVDWRKLPLRTCRTMHECTVCGLTIFAGEKYFDGGYGRRAHKTCAERQPAK